MVKIFDFQYFFGGGRKNEYVDFVNTCFESLQNWTIFGGHFYLIYDLFLRYRIEIFRGWGGGC